MAPRALSEDEVLEFRDELCRVASPVEFVAAASTAPLPAQEALRVTELMYHPSEDSGHEFIELQNISAASVDRDDTNADMTGLALMPYWTGDITSPKREINFQ